MNKQVNVDQFDELKDKLDEQMADVKERQDFFIQQANEEENDELLDELEELEADMAAEELDKLEIGHAIINPEAGQAVKSGKVKEQVQEKDEDEELLA